MAKYRKKPVVVEAFRYAGKGRMVKAHVPDWLWKGLEDGTIQTTNGGDPLQINTLDGKIILRPGGWIIQNTQGEIYACQPDIFEADYEPVE